MAQMHSLFILLEQAENRRDQTLGEHQQALRVHQSAVTQGQDLETYRKEYQTRWTQQLSIKGGAELLHCYTGFLDRLNQAIAHQQHAITYAQHQVETVKTALQEAEMRVASVKKLIERRVQQQQALESRREQKSLDEWSNRATWARLNAEPSNVDSSFPTV
jgi:flagellar protein FliJ